MPADPRTRRRSITTVAVCLTATVLLLATASADTAAEIGRARALEADGRVDIAIEHLRAVLTGESGGTDAALLLELARLTDDVDEALALADEALANTRDMSLRALAHVMRGDYLYAAGLYNQASAEYTTAAELGHDAAVIGLADQPFVPAQSWIEVAGGLGPITVATYDGRRGNPVKLHASVWGLLPTSGDNGARVLMRSRPDLVVEVPCSGSPTDIDTVEDLHQWQNN